MIGRLPTSLEVGGEEFAIRTDYRDVLNIFAAYEDPELEDKDKLFVLLYVLFEDFEDLDPDDYEEALKQANWFLNGGSTTPQDERPNPRVVDWEQDEQILFPAINSVAGCEVRAQEYIHWWTFLGYFMEIRDGTFSQVLHLRQKKAKHKKLEKWEQEFWRDNKSLCEIKKRLTKEEEETKARLIAMLD